VGGAAVPAHRGAVCGSMRRRIAGGRGRPGCGDRSPCSSRSEHARCGVWRAGGCGVCSGVGLQRSGRRASALQRCCGGAGFGCAATNSRKRRAKGSKSTMSREIDGKLRGAATRGDVIEMERLIAEGANPNALVDDWTPLQRAADKGHVAAMAALLKAGAHVDGADSRGWTPLMLAAHNGHIAAMDALIAAGADVHLARNDGDTALHEASANGRLKAARVLLEAGAGADVRNNKGSRPIDVVRDRCDDDHSLDVVCEHHRSRHGVRCHGVVCR